MRGGYACRFFAMLYGDDAAAKYWVLRRKASLYDVPERPVEISGPDALPFLERVFARHISTLKEGRGRYDIACTPQGGVFQRIATGMSSCLYHLTRPLHECTIVDLPFYDREKKIPRGFDKSIP